MIIYKITNNINNKVYIGLTTCSLEYRWSRHLTEAKNVNNKKHLYKAMRKYGLELLPEDVVTRKKIGFPVPLDKWFPDIEKLANKIQKAKIHVGIKTRFIFCMMRMMQMNDWGASKSEKEYWKQNGWLDKKRPWE